jgi:GT2 family glycosyltransferase
LKLFDAAYTSAPRLAKDERATHRLPVIAGGEVVPRDRQPSPSVVVIIATRNRGSSAVRTVQSILANPYPSFKVLVIDQSDTTSTEEALTPFKTDDRFTYIYTKIIGLAHAHNLGISQSSSELIAITDDDCEVPANWLDRIVAAFEQNETVGMLFGNTLATPHNAGEGFVPEYKITTARLLQSSWRVSRARGMGACMALRRKAWLEVGGFDGMMGCGAPMQSGEDADMALRLNLKGYRVLETPQVQVLHYGYRTFAEGRQTVYRDAFGVGASLAKPLRLGHFSLLPLFLYEFFWLTLRPIIWNVVRWHRPFRFTMVRGFVAGVKAALTSPVGAVYCRFRDH